MNDILTALFVAACLAGVGIVFAKSPNTIPSNFGVILLVGSTLVGIGLVAAAGLGLLMSAMLAVFG